MKKTSSHEELFTKVEQLLTANQPSTAYTSHKEMVRCYAETAVLKGHCYDHINLNRIIEQINNFPIGYRIGLLRHLKRIHSLNCIEYDKKHIDTLITKTDLAIQIRKKKFSLGLLLGILSYNITTVLLFLILSISLMSIVFIPAKWPWAEMFECDMLHFSAHNWFNAVCNVICLLFLDIEGVAVKPLTACGVIVLILFKVFNLVVIINFCCKKILEKMGVENAD
jgi:hypothetical protein